MQRLAAGLGAGALPAVTELLISGVHMGDAVASALAAALGRGALPRLEWLNLSRTAIGDAGLVALAPALRRLPGLKGLNLFNNPFGDDVLAALVAPLPPAGAPPPTAGGLAQLKVLSLCSTQITDAGCATLVAAFNSGALPSLESIYLNGAPASAMAQKAVDDMTRAAEAPRKRDRSTLEEDLLLLWAMSRARPGEAEQRANCAWRAARMNISSPRSLTRVRPA